MVGDTNLVHTELHTRTGPPMTPDSVFAIASNSKLLLAMSVGLLISNETLAEERGQRKYAEWGLMDEEMDQGVSLQDMFVPSDGYAKT